MTAPSSKDLLATGDNPGLFLLDAGTGADGVQLTRVLNACVTPPVLHPPYPLDDYGWRCWYQPGTGDSGRVDDALAACIEGHDIALLAVAYDRYLLAAGIDGRGASMARVYNSTRGIVSTSYRAESLFWHGMGWEEITIDPDPIIAAAGIAQWRGLFREPPELGHREPDEPADPEMEKLILERIANGKM